MHPRLVLDTPRPGMSRKRILERVCDQSGNIPPRKKVKRESSKAADDSAERAAEEKLMLLGDLKHDKDFQPRYIPSQSGSLISDSSFWCTRKNGRRSRLRVRRSKPQMAHPTVQSACITLPTESRQTRKPLWSRYSSNIFMRSNKRDSHRRMPKLKLHLPTKLSVHRQPMAASPMRRNWLPRPPNKGL